MSLEKMLAERKAGARRRFLIVFATLSLLGLCWMVAHATLLTETSDPLVNAPLFLFMFYVTVPMLLPVCTLVAAVHFHDTLSGNVLFFTTLMFLGFVPTVMFAHHFITTM